MAEYKGIKGFKVQYLDQDPVPAVAGWSAGGNFPGSNEGMGSTGTQTATLSAGYYNSGSGVTSSFTYNGTSWSPAPSMGTAREQVSNNMTGTQTSAVIACGRNATAFGLQATEEYNGFTWSPSGNYPTQLRDANLFGIQTAAIAAGGNSANPGVATNVNNSYDGSTWTATGNNNTTARLGSVSFGIQTAGILVGGFINSPTPNTYYDNVEEYDGSTWTSGGAYPIATTNLRGGGTQTAGIAFGGSSPGIPQTTATNIYNGATWTAGSNMTTARSSFGSAKSGSSALNLAFAGNTGPATTNATEEYVDYSPYAGQTVENIGQVWYNGTTKALKYTGSAVTGTWSTVANAPYGASNGYGGAGIQTAGIIFGGYETSYAPGKTATYDGSTWTAQPNMPGIFSAGSGGGTQTAAIGAGGTQNGGTPYNFPSVTYKWNGSTWTTGPGVVLYNRGMGGMSGVQTACIIGTGYNDYAPQTPDQPLASQSYDGSTWTTSPNMPNSFNRYAQWGTYSAGGLATGSENVGSPVAASTAFVIWNGSTWSSGNSLNNGRSGASGEGSLTSAVVVGGSPAATELYDGTSWSNGPTNVPTTFTEGSSFGTGTTSLYAGGYTPNTTTTVQQYDQGTENLIKTITVS